METENPPEKKVGVKLAPYNPTNIDCVKIAIEMLQLNAADVVYDLGCGDGRFLIQAKTDFPELHVVGVEYDWDLCETARSLLSAQPSFSPEDWTIQHANVLDVDISPATAMFIYLVPAGMTALKPALVTALQRGCRIVTYVFSIPGLQPIKVELYKQSTKLYLYTAASIVETVNVSVSPPPISALAPALVPAATSDPESDLNSLNLSLAPVEHVFSTLTPQAENPVSDV